MRHEEIHEDDWMEDAPLLASLHRDVELDVPEGYFEGLNARVLDRIRQLPQENPAEEPALPVVEMGGPAIAPPLSRRSNRFNWRKATVWGIAASIVLLVTVGVYLLVKQDTEPSDLFANDTTIKHETMVQLAALEPTEIAAAVDMRHLSDEQIFEALGNDAQTAVVTDEHSVSDDEALEYLKDVDLDAIDLEGLDLGELEGFDN